MTMKMCFAVALVAALSCWMQACGSSEGCKVDDIKKLLPLSGEISGWNENTNAPKNEPGPQATCCATGTLGQGCASDWINGAIDDINKDGNWKGLAQEFFVNGDLQLALYINVMKDDASAAKAYTEILNYRKDVSFADDSLGAGEQHARHGKAMSYWLVDASKKKYFLEVEVKPPSNTSAEAAALDFMKAALNKIP